MSIYNGEEHIADYLLKNLIPAGNHKLYYHSDTLNIDTEIYDFGTTIYSSNPIIGSETADSLMCIARYNGDLTINSGITLTPQVRKKGFIVYVSGNLYLGGKISMTARGAIANGQDLYILKNKSDNSSLFVPAVGALGGAKSVGVGEQQSSNGYAGNGGVNLQTGGGGGGNAFNNNGGYTAYGGAGGKGTSFSGGSGGGGARGWGGGSWIGGTGSSNGGAGGNGYDYSSGLGGGGAGNPGGTKNNGSPSGSNGTGGLLIVIVKGNIIKTNSAASFESMGSAGGNGAEAGGGGGGSGGGSVVIGYGGIYDSSIVMNLAGGIGGTGYSGTRAGSGGNGSSIYTQMIVSSSKYLYKKDSNLWYFNTEWNSINSEVNIEAFSNYGMDNLPSLLPPLTDFEVLNYYSDISKLSSNITLTGTSLNKLILAKGDIDLSSTECINYVNLTSNITGTSIIKLIISIDSGITWKTFNSGSWNVVTPTITDVNNYGITPTMLNSITKEQWADLSSKPGTIRFGYLLNQTLSSESCNTDIITINMDMIGYWENQIVKTNYRSFFGGNKGNLITVKLLTNGDYKINY